jgi:hypothetical protein
MTSTRYHQSRRLQKRSFAFTLCILTALLACAPIASHPTTIPSLIQAKNHPLPLSATPAARVGPESGHRSKTWAYAYDKNNNMTSESFPR